jgi:hypothetical protein
MMQILQESTSDSTLDRLYGWIESFNSLGMNAEPTGIDLISSLPIKSILLWVNLNTDCSSCDAECVPPSWNVDERVLMQSLYKVSNAAAA